MFNLTKQKPFFKDQYLLLLYKYLDIIHKILLNQENEYKLLFYLKSKN